MPAPGGAARPPTPGKRRPGRPKGPNRSTVARMEARAELRKQRARNPLEIDDLEHGTEEVPLEYFARGKVIEKYIMCGKPGCKCKTGGRCLHGPYYYLVVTNPVNMRRPGKPKQSWFYLSKEEADEMRKRLSNFRVLAAQLFSDIYEEMGVGLEE